VVLEVECLPSSTVKKIKTGYNERRNPGASGKKKEY
jgi:hypothetical protein